MARGKFEYWLTEDGLTLLKGYARRGMNDEQIAAKMHIVPSTLYEWKKRFPEISEALKKGKEVADIEVENSLFKKANGYTVDLIKTFKVRRAEYENGKKVSEHEELVTGIDQMHVPADTTAQIFWLKNRMKGEWKDKPVEDVQTAALETAMRALADIIEKPAQNRNIEDFEE